MFTREAALLALLGAVVLHVAWNLLARHTRPEARFIWWGLLSHLVLVGPWSLYALATQADWSWSLALALAVTSVANALYFVALGNAYRHAPVALVYPIARSSPVLIALWSVLFFGEALSLQGWSGIVLSVAGVLMLAFTARQGDARHAVPWGLAGALFTSVYSTSNKFAVPALPGFAAKLGYISVAFLVSFLVLCWMERRQTGGWMPPARPRAALWLVGGLCIGLAYGLVTQAMEVMPAAYAVALNNGGVLLAAILSMTVFGEREHWQARLAGVLVACLGLGMIAAAR
jgi:phosphonate utilization associated putative membrane protein